MSPDIVTGKAPLFERIGARAGLHDLLRHFYADVRQHREIGPIFARQITDWPAHLEKIADFWSGATGGPSVYRGSLPFKHLDLQLEERHFEAWLDLWRRHCRARLGPREAGEMIGLAEAVGRRLRHLLAQDSGLDFGARP